MNKVIWTCLWDGRDAAPAGVKKCLRSWELKNRGWKFRCLDSNTADRYLSIKQYLIHQAVSPDSLSQILRMLLLHEFGGVWVEANLFCVKPLDEWLPGLMKDGFFSFAGSSGTTPSPAFLAAEEFSPVISTFCRNMIQYWKGRDEADDSWFDQLLKKNVTERRAGSVPWNGDLVIDLKSVPESMLAEIPEEADKGKPRLGGQRPASFASLKVSTENIGDHMQILAGLRILSRLGIKPIHYIDRDQEIHSAPQLAAVNGPVGILMNGWFKANRVEWPPHPKLLPLFLGFHIRAFQCPELLMEPSIEFFRKHEPIGCRDLHTHGLLREKGVEGFVSNCLTLSLNRRIEDSSEQTETFVVSRDRKIESFLPQSLGACTFVSHYSGTHDFLANMKTAMNMLELYRSRAKLIVTTLLHCALPAIAMGIPVIVLYPDNNEKGHQSDTERFSSLAKMVQIFRLEEIDQVNWTPDRVPVGSAKLEIFDRFYELASVWQVPS